MSAGVSVSIGRHGVVWGEVVVYHVVMAVVFDDDDVVG